VDNPLQKNVLKGIHYKFGCQYIDWLAGSWTGWDKPYEVI